MILLPALPKKKNPTSCQRIMTEIEAIRVILVGGSRQDCGKKKLLTHSGLCRSGKKNHRRLTFSQPEAQVSDRLTKEDHNIIINSVE